MPSTIRRGLFNKFNRGEVSKDAFAREDVTRVDNACELMENFMPERLGPMSFRPGTEQLNGNPNGIAHFVDDESLLVPFPTSIDDPAMIVFGVNSGLPSIDFMRASTYEFFERAVTTTTWIEGDFGVPLGTGWTDADVGGAVSNIASNELTMTGTGTDEAKVWQTSSTTEANTPHGFLFVVDKGEVLLQIGTDGVDSGDLFEGFLQIGYHHIEVESNNSDDITVTLSNANLREARMQMAELQGDSTLSVQLETALRVSILNLGANDYKILRSLRWAQSADVMYFCGGRDIDQGFQGWLPFEVRRWNPTSFSVQRFVNVFGPYEPINITNLTMEPQGAIDGNMTVAPSRPYFQVARDSGGFGFGNSDYGFGTLLKIAVNGQIQSVSGITAGTATQGVFVFGTGDARNFDINITQTGGYTRIELQKSFDEITWQLVPGEAYTGGGNISKTFNDGLDAAEIFYRLELVTPGPVATLTMQIDYAYGTLESQGRIVENDSSVQVQVEWYVAFNGPISTEYPDWSIGSWGGKRGMPTAVAFHEGRLWFAGGNKIWGSESDFYESFDTLVEGASASIQRTIGFGAAERIHWLAPSARLVAGTAIAEIDIRSSAFGEVLTPENVNLKAGSDLGVADIVPIVLDNEIIFVQRGSTKLIGIDFSVNTEAHAVEDFNMLNQDVLRDGGGVVQIAVARNPETRIYCVMDDGSMRILLRDITEGILGWSRVTIRGNGGGMESVVSVGVLPSEDEDEIWITTASRKVLKFAPFNLAEGESDSRNFDSYEYFLSPGTTTLTLHSLSGTVGVWMDGVDQGDFVVAASQITVAGADVATNVTVGYRYTATYKSNKLTDYDDIGTLGQRKRIINTGLIMRDYVQGVITIGPDLTDLGNMPELEAGKPVVAGTEDYDFFPFHYNGESITDPRIAIQATGPVKILAIGYDVKDTSRKTRQG